MDTKADLLYRSGPRHDVDDAPALDGLVGAALAVSAAALVLAALVLAALAHTTELTLGTTTRAVVIIGALVLGAVAGWVGQRLWHHGVPADRLRPRSVR